MSDAITFDVLKPAEKWVIKVVCEDGGGYRDATPADLAAAGYVPSHAPATGGGEDKPVGYVTPGWCGLGNITSEPQGTCTDPVYGSPQPCPKCAEHRDRLVTIIDEEFGLQPVEPDTDALLTTLERLLFEARVKRQNELYPLGNTRRQSGGKCDECEYNTPNHMRAGKCDGCGLVGYPNFKPMPSAPIGYIEDDAAELYGAAWVTRIYSHSAAGHTTPVWSVPMPCQRCAELKEWEDTFAPMVDAHFGRDSGQRGPLDESVRMMIDDIVRSRDSATTRATEAEARADLLKSRNEKLERVSNEERGRARIAERELADAHKRLEAYECVVKAAQAWAKLYRTIGDSDGETRLNLNAAVVALGSTPAQEAKPHPGTAACTNLPCPGQNLNGCDDTCPKYKPSPAAACETGCSNYGKEPCASCGGPEGPGWKPRAAEAALSDVCVACGTPTLRIVDGRRMCTLCRDKPSPAAEPACHNCTDTECEDVGDSAGGLCESYQAPSQPKAGSCAHLSARAMDHGGEWSWCPQCGAIGRLPSTSNKPVTYTLPVQPHPALAPDVQRVVEAAKNQERLSQGKCNDPKANADYLAATDRTEAAVRSLGTPHRSVRGWASPIVLSDRVCFQVRTSARKQDGDVEVIVSLVPPPSEPGKEST